MIDYLKKFGTELPRWLKDYQPGEKIPMEQILRERIFFYPGSAFDGQPIKTFNISRSAVVFLYADYLFGRAELTEECQKYGLKGYRILYQYEIPMEELIPMEDYRPFPNLAAPFCRIIIFEKDSSRGIVEGSDRLILIYTAIDAVYLFRKFFAERGIVPFGVLLEDYGFGCNYTRFGEGGLLSECAHEYGNYPRFLLCREDRLAWRGYHRLPGLEPEYGGMHDYGRFLYER